MSPVRLVGFRTLSCGCVIGCYEQLATRRELCYVEEKGAQCENQAHRRNHTVHSESPDAQRTKPSFTRAS